MDIEPILVTGKQKSLSFHQGSVEEIPFSIIENSADIEPGTQEKEGNYYKKKEERIKYRMREEEREEESKKLPSAESVEEPRRRGKGRGRVEPEEEELEQEEVKKSRGRIDPVDDEDEDFKKSYKVKNENPPVSQSANYQQPLGDFPLQPHSNPSQKQMMWYQQNQFGGNPPFNPNVMQAPGFQAQPFNAYQQQQFPLQQNFPPTQSNFQQPMIIPNFQQPMTQQGYFPNQYPVMYQQSFFPNTAFVEIQPPASPPQKGRRRQEEKDNEEREEQERADREKQERERIEREKLEKEKFERERQEKEKFEREKERIEREKQEKERAEREERELDRLEKERLERERIDKDEKGAKATLVEAVATTSIIEIEKDLEKVNPLPIQMEIPVTTENIIKQIALLQEKLLDPVVSVPTSTVNSLVLPNPLLFQGNSSAPPQLTFSIPSPIPYIATPEFESSRLSALHSLGLLESGENPRLNKITQMTTRLLGRSCCVITLVDTDKVIWKSNSNNAITIKEEPRYESFCSWVVQDETGRGITILDSKSDPRCTHIRSKPGLEFYAGVPLVLGGKFKIGALSIQGPRTETPISLIDMNILHEMSVWAAGELDSIIQQKALEHKDALLQSRDKISSILNSSKKIEKEADNHILEKALNVIRGVLKAHSVLLFKITTETAGKTFQSVLQSYSIHENVNGNKVNLTIGEEMFHELCNLTMKKPGSDQSLFFENLKTGSVTREVDHYLSKTINKCLSEIVWGTNGPSGILAVFFEGNYRTISKDEFGFFKDIIPNISALLDHLELKETFHQATNFFKNIGASIKKHSIPLGNQLGLAPCIMIIEPKISAVKGYLNRLSFLDSNKTEGLAMRGSVKATGNAVSSLLGSSNALNRELLLVENREVPELLPIECFDVVNDFTLILEKLANDFNLKNPKKFGSQYYLFANYGPETGSYRNVAAFAHQLLFSLDSYNQTRNRNLRVCVGIHSDFLPVDFGSDPTGLKDQLLSIANCAYLLGQQLDSVVVSETFHHKTRSFCSYEACSPISSRVQGVQFAHRLTGISNIDEPEPVALVTVGVPHSSNAIIKSQTPLIASTSVTPVADNTNKPLPPISKPKPVPSTKGKKCIIL